MDWTEYLDGHFTNGPTCIVGNWNIFFSIVTLLYSPKTEHLSMCDILNNFVFIQDLYDEWNNELLLDAYQLLGCQTKELC